MDRGGHAHRGGVDQKIAAVTAGTVQGIRFEPKVSGQSLGFGPVAGQNSDAPTGFLQHGRGGAGGSAGSQQDGPARRALQATAQGVANSVQVGIVSPQAVFPPDQGVGRPACFHAGVPAVHVAQHGHLVRKGDAEPAEAFQIGREGLQAGRGQGQVTTVQPELPEGVIVHLGRQGMTDGMADHAKKKSIGIDAVQAVDAFQVPGGELSRGRLLARASGSVGQHGSPAGSHQSGIGAQVSHGHSDDGKILTPGSRHQLQQAKIVGKTGRQGGDLHHVGLHRQNPPENGLEIRGSFPKVMVGPDQPPGPVPDLCQSRGIHGLQRFHL